MNKRMNASLTAIVICVGLFVAAPAKAQSSSGPYWGSNETQHHQWIYRMMKDMTEQMDQMTELMLRGDLTPDQSSQMTQRMGQMSTMMRHLSGLAARPALSERKWKKQTELMREQMDGMLRDSRMKPHG